MENRLPGVTISKKKNQSLYYRSSLTYRNKHISLGSFDSMMKAHLAYREAWCLLEDKSLSIESWTDHKIISFEKWVCLANFRDNHIYICNPIYTRQKFFYYYLSPNTCLIFDVEDLFYYSMHKIMRRGGHLFVSDYGMQYNIMNRYGIKNYAVQNRDYKLINGNPLDLRYENILIINRYQGVQKIQVKGVTKYKVLIHMNGNYTVGIYDSEIEAAIAYNKAVDFVRTKNVTKNYSINFIEEITNATYAEIYSRLKLSKKLRTLPQQ